MSEAEPPLSVRVPRMPEPSKICTSPVAAAGVTTTVSVTDWPSMAGFGEAVNTTVVAGLLTVCVMVSEELAA